MGLKRAGLLLLCVVSAALFFSLGVWQLDRRVWKLDLIARVESRIHAPAVPAPLRSQWPKVSAASDEYRRVRVKGYYLQNRTVLVDALTELGPGFWVLTPLNTADGTVLVNRGFVRAQDRQTYPRPAGPQEIIGLLRMPEPGGRFLRPNRPEQSLWFSRDVNAIAASQHLGEVAPYFVDADASGRPGYPVGGLTVVQFRNMHLAYAFIWFSLSLIACYGVWLLGTKDSRRLKHQ